MFFAPPALLGDSEAENECPGGAQLNRSLGEFEGLIRDPDLSSFAKDYQLSRPESGSGEPPDRAQICAMMLSDAISNFFFSEPILGPPKWTFGRGNTKNAVKKVDRALLRLRTETQFGAKRQIDGSAFK